MRYNRLAHGMCQLQVAQECGSLNVDVAAAQGVHARLADGEHLRVPRTLFQQGPVVGCEAVHVVPRVISHRVPASGLGVELPRIDRDEGTTGVKAVSMEVENVHHGTGS